MVGPLLSLEVGDTSLDLGGEWTLWFADGAKQISCSPGSLATSGLERIPAMVPGTVELDLSRAGRLPEDLFFGENILTVRPFESYEWWYERTFHVDEDCGDRVAVLHFDGVDCLAEYWLNGQRIGQSNNMLVSHELDVSTTLRRGSNHLVVHLSPPGEWARRQPYAPYWSGGLTGHAESVWVRKAPHMYGWDIMPRAVSAGLWGPVRLELRQLPRIASFYLATVRASETSADLVMTYEVDGLPQDGAAWTLAVSARSGSSTWEREEVLKFPAGTVRQRVEDPRLWWPRGYGEPNLYEVAVELRRDGTPVGRRRERHGIRTVALQRRDGTDTTRGQFRFVINGEPIFVNGTNWVPLSPFHSQDRDLYPSRLQLLADTDCTMVRCWGGSVYPDDTFFEFCDGEGILVWQDFAMACMGYPQTEAFQATLGAEVEQVVRRLRNHPSLALWSGDNEVDQIDVGRGIDPNRNVLTRELLPRLLHHWDPYRPYLPSSPYVSPEVYASGKLQRMPETHLWGPRDYFKSRFYRDTSSSFVSEIGFFGLPSVDSLRRFLPEEQLWPPDNRGWLVHSTDPSVSFDSPFWRRCRAFADRIVDYFGELPSTLDDIVLASQIVQAEGYKFAIEWARQREGEKTGLLWWSLFDGWPEISDGVVDFYGDKKLAYRYIRRSQQPLLALIGESDTETQPLFVSNHTRKTWSGNLSVRDAGSDEVLWQASVHCPPGSLTQATELPLSSGRLRLIVIEWEGHGVAGANHYVVGHPPFTLERYRTWLDLL